MKAKSDGGWAKKGEEISLFLEPEAFVITWFKAVLEGKSITCNEATAEARMAGIQKRDNMVVLARQSSEQKRNE